MIHQTLPVLFLALLPASVLAQTTKPAAISDWPKLTGKQQDRVQDLLKNFAVKDEKTHDASQQELITLGPGVVPILIARLTDLSININDKLLPVLDRICKPEHSLALAKHARDGKVVVRRFVLGKLATFGDPQVAAVFQTALKDKDADAQFRAALGLASTGDLAELERVFARCMQDWLGNVELVGKAMVHARGNPATSWLVERLGKGSTQEKVTALRLLRYCGAKDGASALKPLLDAEDHGVKKETINALRAIVEGQPPIEDLSVFQAIELAKEWKARL